MCIFLFLETTGLFDLRAQTVLKIERYVQRLTQRDIWEMEAPGDGLLVLFAKFPGFQSHIIGCWFLMVSTATREGERAWWKKGGL